MYTKLHKTLALVLLVMLFSACRSDYISITIRNDTSSKIDIVGVSSYNLNVVFNNIEPSGEITKQVFFNYKGDIEGGFAVAVHSRGETKNPVVLGYFANSADIKSKYNFIIYDQFLIKEIE